MKNTLKKAIALCTGFALCLSLAGCASTETTGSTGSASTSNEESAETEEAVQTTDPSNTYIESSDLGKMFWPTSDAASSLPVPFWAVTDADTGDISLTGTIESEDENYFWCEIAVESQEDFQTYVQDCKDAGFTEDYYSGDDYYWANTEDGYELSLDYYSAEDSGYDCATIDITVYYSEPVYMEEITWPTSGAAASIPVPSWANEDADSGKITLSGVINSDSSTYFSADIEVESQDAFQEYVQDCKDAGFTVDYSSGDTYFYGTDENGCTITMYFYDESDSDYDCPSISLFASIG